MTRTKGIFLRAEWRDLLMLNYGVDPSLLANHIIAEVVLRQAVGKVARVLYG